MSIFSNEYKISCEIRTFFEMEKNVGKILRTIDKPQEGTAAALGVSLMTVDRAYLESQATCVQVYIILPWQGLANFVTRPCHT